MLPDRALKDRAKPFDRKHRRYWLTTAGGMVLIMSINLGLGFGVMRCKTDPPPPADYWPIPPMIDPPDAAVDGSADAGDDDDDAPARDPADARDAGVTDAAGPTRDPADARDAGAAPSLPDDVER
ncbi:MAG: hypothetical protein IPL61_04250 [Myxococcales bacterium]|nr:hypothetical protein [Myxococcales bacterium]